MTLWQSHVGMDIKDTFIYLERQDFFDVGRMQSLRGIFDSTADIRTDKQLFTLYSVI